MKLVVFGSRRIAKYAGQPREEQRLFKKDDVQEIVQRLAEFRKNLRSEDKDIEELVCGLAKEGADLLGYCWAEWEGIPIKEFPADWKKYGKAAGHIRNKQMAAYADFGIGVWDGFSSGTRNMIKELEAHDKSYIIWPVGLGNQRRTEGVD